MAAHYPDAFPAFLARSIDPALVPRVLEALEGEAPSVSLRLNPSALKECPFPGARPVPWSPWGYLLEERPVFTLDPLFHAGCYYVQDSSAMFVGHVFREVTQSLESGCNVLDLCAAPGGKTTDLAASLRERFSDRYTLIANEVMRGRYAVLRGNVQGWGDRRVGCTSRDPSAFGTQPVFDAILADVPCSGEGMFRKDAQAVAEWSEPAVQFCAARSRRILSDIWPTLRGGGILVYSTCTFNTLENDDTVAWIASELGAEVLELPSFPPVADTRLGKLLLPGLVPGEGQYVAALRKKGDPGAVRPADPFLLYRAERVEPAPAEAPLVNVDRAQALQYLHGDALRLPAGAPLGPVLIGYEGHVLGPGKNLGQRCNNLYPKGRRIRMDVSGGTAPRS